MKRVTNLSKTFIPKFKDIKRNWFIVDADGLVLGRLASILANRLRGKHKTFFTPNMQCGDNIIVINSKRVLLKGQKRDNKKYYKHTGYPGGIKITTPDNILSSKTPNKVIELAVKRMIPKGPLGRKILKQLHVYPNVEHPHQAQNPQSLDVKKMNKKNF